jgi:hypothetical protein
MPKTSRITEIREMLKTPGIGKNTKASFNQPKSPKPSSPKPSSPKPSSPKPSSPKPSSPKRSRQNTVVESQLPMPLPGLISTETYEERMVVARPSAERYANTDILKNNPKVSMEELSIILGVTKIHLPKIDTKVESLPLPLITKSSSPRSKSPKPTNQSKSPKPSSPKNLAPKSPKKDICKDIKIGGQPIKKEMISAERSVKSKPVYKNDELKEIARQLGVSTTGTKDQIVSGILKELENRGC